MNTTPRQAISGPEQYIKVKGMAWIAGTTITDLCAHAGINPATIWRWKHGKARPTESTTRKLEEATRRLVSTNQFVGLIKNVHPEIDIPPRD